MGYSNKLSERIGDTMKVARNNSSLTQTELAKRLGTKQPSISRIEKGGSLPSLNFLQRMAKELGREVSVELVEQS